MSEDYERFVIREYDHWKLFLHVNQFPYLGRAYAWAKRDDANLLTDMNPNEARELHEIIVPQWWTAVQELYQADRPNMAILGNTSPHLHAHLIPRYQSPREFEGIEFVDPNPTGNYAPYPKKRLDEALLLRVRDDLAAKLS